MFDQEIPARLLARLKLSKDGFGEIFEEESSRIQITRDVNGTAVESAREAGSGLRIIENSVTRYRYADGFDESALENRRKGAPASGNSSACGNQFEFDTELSTLTGLADRAFEVTNSIDGRLQNVTVRVLARKSGFRIHNTEGIWVNSEKQYSELSIHVVLGDEENSASSTQSLSATDIYGLTQEDVVKLGYRTVEAATAKLENQPFSDGIMDVVFMGQATGVFIHETLGHQLEADVLNGRRHSLADYLGHRLAPPAITLIDDPSLSGLWGSFSFDDEGSRALPTVLIDKGVISGFLTDRLARLAGFKGSMGSARRESFRHPPLPRMSNTYLAPGAVPPAAILEETPRGILVERMRAGSLNPITGSFVLHVNEGKRVENGKTTSPVSDLMIMGTRKDALNGIVDVGSDLSFSREAAWCQKKGQTVPISQGGSTLKIRNLCVLAKRQAKHMPC